MLQAVLSNHTAIATRSEPWVQLLQAPLLNPDLVRAPFDWKITVDAVGKVEEGEKCLLDAKAALKGVADKLYSEAAEACGADYFLDKTPRYYYMLEELYALYPDAQFLILYRNPVSVLASIHKTWLSEKPFESLYDYSGDLIDAPRLMDEFSKAHGASDRVMTVAYEQLTQDPKAAFAGIFSWLGLEFSEDLLSYDENASYSGKYGDPVGVKRGRVEAHPATQVKQYTDVLLNKRLANLAAGLAAFYQQQGFTIPGKGHWQAPRRTREFDRFLRVHQLKSRKNISTRACIQCIIDRLMVRLGL